MAYHGPAYGLSRECQMKAQAKFSIERAREALDWVEAVLQRALPFASPDEGLRDQLDFAQVLKDGIALCELINALEPGTVKKINTMKAPFKQRENLELFLKGCESYGLKSQDLFQVNDLYEHKNLYMVIDCIYALGGMAQKKNWHGPVIGVKVADAGRAGREQQDHRSPVRQQQGSLAGWHDSIRCHAPNHSRRIRSSSRNALENKRRINAPYCQCQLTILRQHTSSAI